MSTKVIVGGQYGSEGKGAIAGYLSKGPRKVVAVRVAGPNAGHSVVSEKGAKWAFRQVPVAAVVNPDAKLVIAAGSEIDEGVLHAEIDLLEAAGYQVKRRLFIDAQATILDGGHQTLELGMTERIGSTAKGVGAARSDRIMRTAQVYGDRELAADTAPMLRRWESGEADIIIEGTQGYALGLHAGWYPFCTSSDCTTVDFLSMAGFLPRAVDPWVVLRTHPIRVAGNSGPMHRETTWDALRSFSGGHIGPEYTTVTQKMRRVGDWDARLAFAAVEANGGELATIALTMFDYWFPSLYQETDPATLTGQHWAAVRRVEADCQAPVELLGTGPNSVIDLRSASER